MKAWLVAIPAAAAGLLAASLAFLGGDVAVPAYRPPDNAVVTVFPATGDEARRLTIEAATDISYMRPFVERFQSDHSDTAIVYVDFISSALLQRAKQACDAGSTFPDLYLSVSTDHLVELANYGCSTPVSTAIADKVPKWAQWRREVIAFAVEPAVIVYNTDLLDEDDAPRSHVELIELLRSDKYDWQSRIGTYDIEKSGLGYNYAAFDARHSAIYGRLIETFGRVGVRTYCCSNLIIDSVARREIALAYNVQMSFAYAAQQQGKPIGVVLPADYQAIQTRSVMMTPGVRDRDAATAFIDFLVSPAAQQLAQEGLVPPGGTATGASVFAQAFVQSPVGPSLLALRDRARRARLIDEWRSAMYPPD